MARYIENLNSCTDPISGDYLWLVDASAGATDKDRKVDAAAFAIVGRANTFTAAQTINSTVSIPAQDATSVLQITNVDLGSGTGGQLNIGRNTNASTPAPGALVLGKVNVAGNCYVWCDDSGNIRTQLNATVTSANRNGGTVVGAQTSSLDSKNVLEGVTGIEDVLAAVQRGAEAVRRFTYKSGAFGGEEFEGVVVDYAPRYGMDRDAEHEAGKSLNLINAVGDLLRAVAWLVEREQERDNA